MSKKYQPAYTRAQAWEYIENRFQKDWGEAHMPMCNLIRHIRAGDLIHRLFAYSSIDKIVISIYESIDYQKEALHIYFDPHAKQWSFEYFALPFQAPEFKRNYPAELGIEKFDNFIKMIGW